MNQKRWTKLIEKIIKKLESVQMEPLMWALFDYVLSLEQHHVEPRIDEMYLTPDGFITYGHEDEIGANYFLGSKEQLFQNLNGAAEVAKLNKKELLYLNRAIPKTLR